MKFLQILRTLSESERRDFGNYLKAPIGRKPRVSNRIIDAFLNHENFEVFMNENFNKRSQWNSYSELTNSLEDYLAAKKLLQNINDRNEFLAEEFSHRGLTDLSKAYYEKEVSKLNVSIPDERILTRFLHLQQKYSELLNFDGEFKKLESILNSRYEIHVIKSVFESLMLQVEYENRATQSKDLRLELFRFYNNSIDFKRIIQLTKKTAPRFYPLLSIVQKISYLQTQPFSFSHFEKVRKHFYKYMDCFTLEFKTWIYFLFINYLIRCNNLGYGETDKYLFELIRKKIGEGITDDLQHKIFGRSHFRDYVTVALRLNELKWASEFIDNYSTLLPPGHRKNEENVTRAMLSLKKQDYNSSADFIANVRRSDYLYSTDYFRIIIISKFELNDYMECMKEINKFKRYLWTGTDVPEPYIEKYKRFLKIVSLLIEYKQTGDASSLEEFNAEIDKDMTIPGSNWILEKARELKKMKYRRASVK